ncbi:uncharacterized protein LOC109796531 [Cajanus cajan]|nr:uncharacterized protein LOC109796531 [Cajanus cajan]
MDSTIKLHSASGPAYADLTGYRRMIGKLVYLTHTRPDLSYAVSHLSQFLDKPTVAHYNAAIRVLKYLKNEPGKGVFFPASSSDKVQGFSDSNWASCVDTRRSVTGYCFFIGDSLICWKSKRQRTVSRSSAEAEYRALSLAGYEAQWLTYLFADLKLQHYKPISLFCDNQSALHIAANPVFHERTKHIEIDCHSIREKVQAGIVHLLPVRSAHQLADVFTKPLASGPFHLNISKLGMCNIHLPA